MTSSPPVDIREQRIEAVARALFEGDVYQGYTDEFRESEWSRNQGLYRSRARRAVEASDAALGIPADRLDAVARGETVIVPANPTNAMVQAASARLFVAPIEDHGPASIADVYREMVWAFQREITAAQEGKP